mmetsp:Transcript_75755/g.222127  ORF Transcript_75755/g.222127 Transcript_75755/m.222127 type:complete len:203 (+) Transcript_75755:32-640(+)
MNKKLLPISENCPSSEVADGSLGDVVEAGKGGLRVGARLLHTPTAWQVHGEQTAQAGQQGLVQCAELFAEVLLEHAGHRPGRGHPRGDLLPQQRVRRGGPLADVRQRALQHLHVAEDLLEDDAQAPGVRRPAVVLPAGQDLRSHEGDGAADSAAHDPGAKHQGQVEVKELEAHGLWGLDHAEDLRLEIPVADPRPIVHVGND